MASRSDAAIPRNFFAGYQRGTSGSEEVIYSFKGHPEDGAAPAAGLLNVKGTFYGTTFRGGKNRLGTVFKLTADGKETLVYSFAGGATDGAYPQSSLVYVNGTLYGTTSAGGATGCSNIGCGAVYAITPSGTEIVLHIFGSSGDGAEPYADGGLVNMDGTLYGTTYVGGAHGRGTVFSITTAGAERILYSFKGGRDGAYPLGGLIAVNGVLYGTTENGGGSGCDGGCGTVFKMSASGVESQLFRFNGNDGEYPYQGSLAYLKGSLYGTTFYGGYGYGEVFAVTLNGHEHVLYGFQRSDGEQPRAGLTILHGVLYGTTSSAAFSLTTTGEEHVLHSFSGPPDGVFPADSPLITAKGALYGTTLGGGTHGKGRGTIYKLTP